LAHSILYLTDIASIKWKWISINAIVAKDVKNNVK